MRYPQATQLVGFCVRKLTTTFSSPLLGIALLAIVVAGSLLVLPPNPSEASSNSTAPFVGLSWGSTGGDAATIASFGAKPFFALPQGHKLNVEYRGGFAQELQTGGAIPRSLASADFDGDGAPDVVTGYELNGVGVVSLQRGNPDAFAPKDESIYGRLQQGYRPPSLLGVADTYSTIVPAHFLAAGDFNQDGKADVVTGARGAGLYLMAGDGAGRLLAPEQLALPGYVTALAAGEFRVFDGMLDLAVAVDGPSGPALVIFEGQTGVSQPSVNYPLQANATDVSFGRLDDDPFLDVAVATGSTIEILHGWGRGKTVSLTTRSERLSVPAGVEKLSVGNFVWDRKAQSELAALAPDGSVYLFEQASNDNRRFTEEELIQRGNEIRRAPRVKTTDADIDNAPAWRQSRSPRWSQARNAGVNASFAGSGGPRGGLTVLSSRGETDDLILLDRGQKTLNVVHDSSTAKNLATTESVTDAMTVTSTDVETTGAPITTLTLPRKINGDRSMLVLSDQAIAPTTLDFIQTGIVVDTTADNAALSTCGAGAGDCSLRGAVTFANNNANLDGTAITFLAGVNAINLTIPNGSNGCDSNTSGDLAINKSTTITGNGSGTTIIAQTAATQRVMCLNLNFTAGLVYSFSGLTITGGRDITGVGGGGVVGGADNNIHTFTNVIVANNQSSNDSCDPNCTNTGGGGINIYGGTLTIQSSTIGGANVPTPGSANNVVNTTVANMAWGTAGSAPNIFPSGSGGGIAYSPGLVTPGTSGTLTVAGTTVSNNRAQSTSAGGGGAELTNVNGGIGSFAINGNSVFTGNSATSGNGGGVYIGTFELTVTNASFTSNTAPDADVTSPGRAGAIYLAGGGLKFGNTTTFSNNTATVTAANCISVNSGGTATTGVHVTGTGNNIDDNVEIQGGGFWDNANGTSVTFENLTLVEGTFTGNNSATTVTGNLTLSTSGNPADANSFSGGTGSLDINGNLSITDGTFTAPSGNTTLAGNFSGSTFAHGSGTFIFDGTGAQSISNSPTFNTLTVNKSSGTLTLLANIGVAANLNLSAGTFDLQSFTANRTAGGGTMTLSNGTLLKIGGTNGLPVNYTTHSIGATNTVEYAGTNQPVTIPNSAQLYGHLTISGSGIKTLQNHTSIVGNLTINAAQLDASASNFSFNIGGAWTNNVGLSGFNARNATVTFNGGAIGQDITGAGNTTFYNLTLNNGGTVNFNNTTTTIQNNLVVTTGSMQPQTSTIVFTGAAGSISGAQTKQFNNLQVNAGANIANATGGNTNIFNDYTNNGTFTQAAPLSTTFFSGVDNIHSMSGSGTSTFGLLTINLSNTLNATHNFNVVGATFTANGTLAATSGTATFNGSGLAQTIAGDGAKAFSGLTINNGSGVTLTNGGQPVDASVSGALTLTTDFSVASNAILQQSGTSAGAADVIGTVRRTDLGVTEKSFGNSKNTITINSGTAPTSFDFNLVKAAPGTFPPNVKVVPRTYTLDPTGGSGISATVKLRYIDPAELTPASITESRLILWKDVTGTWTPQGGAADAANDFVTLSGVSSFSPWAIAEGADLTITKANDTSNDAVTGESWNWTLTASNAGSPSTFTAGQTILSDNLPNSNLNYGTPAVQNVSNITGSGNISCAIVSNDLTCTANGGSVTFDSNVGASSFQVVFSATPQAIGTYQNPRAAGSTQIDPNNNIVESNEGNNTAANNTVTVTAASTTTAIISDNPDPSVVGGTVTVVWDVDVSPGPAGTALTGNVTVSDGTVSCFADVSAGQCNLIFTTAGAKNLTATYAGDSNYNGSASTPATAHSVNAASTTTTITEDNPDSSTPGQAVLVKYTVTVNSPGSGTPTGTVTVSDGVDSNNTCTVADGVAGCSLTLNTKGNRTITATYLGNADFNTSSDTEDHQVCGSSVVTTTADSGAGSLRQVIADACDGGTITFDSAGLFGTPQTITLTTGEIAIDKDLTINAGSSQITISGNNASRVFNVNSGKTATIVRLTLSGGSAANGGAVLNGGTLTLKNSTVSGNASTGSGAGIHNSNVLNIVNSTISGNNSAIDGGGILQDGVSPTLYIVNSTVSGNTANGFGGGLDLRNGTVTILNTTITGNHADNDDGSGGGGGGIRVQTATVTIRNTIVAGNYLGSGTGTVNDIEGTVSGNNNLIGDTGTAGGLTNGVNGNIVGAVIANVLDTVLANNGGPTQSHRLINGSVALDAGENASLPIDTFDADGDANTGESLDVDQRGAGHPRTADSADPNATQTVDIGAFELHPSIQDIGNKTTSENTAVSQFSFHLGDATGSGSPLIQSITASSSNTTLIPNANVVISGGASDTVRNVDITPATNQTGTSTITITVTATNGQIASDSFDVTVTPPNDPVVNDPPVNSVPGAQSVNEDAVLTFNAANFNVISISDPDATTAQVTLTATNGTISLSGTAGLTFTPPADGVADTQMTFTGSIADINTALNGLTYTPAANFNGAASLTIFTNDQGNTGTGGPQSDTDVINITVNNVNDPPSFTKGADQTDDEDAGAQTVNGWATNISSGPGDPAQSLTFTVTVTGTTGTLSFASAPAINSTTGTLTYTVNADTNGSATLDVTLSDGTDTSPAQTFTITVNAVNDAPSFQIAGNPAAVTEDAGAQTVNSFATNFQPGPATATDEAAQTLVGYTVTQTGSTGSLTFSSGPAIDTAGTLIYTPTGDTFGTATFNAVATDSGSGTTPNVNQSAPVAFTITVNAVNDPPSFTLAGNPPSVAIGSGAQTVNGFASNISQGPNETGQTLTFNLTPAGTTGTLAFSTGPDIDETTGNLTHTPTAGTSGTATFNVTLSDNGGGTDTSAVQQFTISVVAQLALIVNVTGDAADINVGDNICDSDAAVGNQCTLRAAIQETNSAASDDTIGFDAALTGSTITLNTALDAINGNLVITGLGASNLTVARSSVGGTPDFRIFSINSGLTVTISGLTVSNGNAVGSIPANSGGGIFNAATLILNDSVVSGNTASAGGGGIRNIGTLTLNNTTVSGNTANTGGGILNNVLNTGVVSVTLNNSTISGNNSNGPGAGIFNGAFSGTSMANLTINNSTISGNINSGSSGGGISNAATFGNAVSTLTINNSTISSNSASSGGGLAHTSSGTGSTATATITNCTITGNSSGSATDSGGGIFTSAFSSTTALTLRNTIVAGNLRSSGTIASDVSGAVDPASLNNLIGDGSDMTGMTNGVNGNQVGTSGTPVIPRLGPLGNNGGPTQTHALLAGSPAVDAGSNANLPADTLDRDGDLDTAEPIPFDQRGAGFARVVDGPDADTTATVDIGAFEAQVSVQDIGNRNINEDGSDSFAFDVGGSASITSVTATSSNTALVPNNVANLTVTGSGSTRTLTINPVANGFGSTTITVTVNSATGSAVDTFLFTVNPVADTPSVTNGSTTEDTITPLGQLVISRNVVDGAEVTHFKITSITNGTLFQNNGVTPIANNEFITFLQGNAGLRFLPAPNSTASGSFTVQAATGNIDAALGGGTATATITVADANDQPTLDPISPNPLNILEDAGLQNVNLSGISAGGGETQTLVVTATSNNTGLIPNPTVTYTSPNATGSISFTPVANANGTAEITVTVDDNSGGTETVSRTFTVNVGAVNDTPSFTKGANQVVNEDSGVQSVAGWATAISAGPADESGQTVTFEITNNTNSALFSAQPAVSSTGTLTYTPAANASGSATITVRISDNGGTANGGQNTSATQTFDITVNAANDAPVNTVPSAQSTTTNNPLTFSSGNGNLISIADIDAATNPVQLTLTATNGTFSLSGTAGLVFSVGDGTADASMTFTGTIANINTALNGLAFTPTGGFNGAASLQIVTNDQANTGSGGALADSDTINITVNAGGTLQFSSATYNVNENGGSAAITITRTGGSAGTATVLFQTSNGTAGAGDYTTISQAVTFVDGDISETVNVPITDDVFNEPDKTVNLTLSNVGGSGQLGTPVNAVLTINDDDAAGGIVRFSSATFTVGESSGPATITVERVGSTTNALTVDYQSSDHSNPADFVDCTAPGPGLASSRCDFVTAVGTLKFGVGQSSATFTVLINQDNDVEGTETLSLTLSNTTGGSVLGTPSTATLEITDDLTEGAANPIDTSSEFVKQHYRDFLNREPDAPGLAFWTDNIEKCNDPARRPAGQTVEFCIDKQRESTAIAFFVAPEFQMTGGFVYRLYKGSLPGGPDYDGSSPPGGRFPTYLEFMRDVRQVAEGIVVSDQISGAKVEANREQLAQDFVQRPEFVALYGGLTNTQYVDALFTVTGITPSQADKDALVAELNAAPNATQGRASVLRKIVDGTQVIAENNVPFMTTYGQAFHQQEFSRTFVFMEYIGYLRRNPDDAGFVHWLGKLNFFGGNPFQAEMVRAFILSPEYRSRFGQP